MASEIARIDEQLRRSFEGGAWHGPAVLEVLGQIAVLKRALPRLINSAATAE